MTTISKAMLLLAPGEQGAGFRAALQKAASTARGKLAPWELLRLSFQIAENPLGGTAHDAVARPEKFEAVVELTSPSAEPGLLQARHDGWTSFTR